MNPNDYYAHLNNRRQRAREYRGCADPYPLHHNIFIQQHLDQERRRQSMNPNLRGQPINLHQHFFMGRPKINFFFNCPPPPMNHSAAADATAAAAAAANPNYYGSNANINYSHLNMNSPEPPAAEKKHSAEKILSMCHSFTAAERDLNDTCTICIAHFVGGQSLESLPCNHKFHTKCIKQWFERQTMCPLCRANFGDDDDEDTPASASPSPSPPPPPPVLPPSAFLQGYALACPFPIPMQNVNIHYAGEPVEYIDISSDSENEHDTDTSSRSSSSSGELQINLSDDDQDEDEKKYDA